MLLVPGPVSCAVIAAVVLTAAGIQGVYGVHNTSASMPVGYYRPALNGHIVKFCPPAPWDKLSTDRHYRAIDTKHQCADGRIPLLKPIVAREGDTVIVGEEGISVMTPSGTGKVLLNSKARTVDTEGRPLAPMPKGVYPVEKGTVWTVSPYEPKSFDSRYYGAIKIRSVLGRYEPLFPF